MSYTLLFKTGGVDLSVVIIDGADVEVVVRAAGESFNYSNGRSLKHSIECSERSIILFHSLSNIYAIISLQW